MAFRDFDEYAPGLVQPSGTSQSTHDRASPTPISFFTVYGSGTGSGPSTPAPAVGYPIG